MSDLNFRDERRAVVTGIGVVAANGIGVTDYWRTLTAGQSGVGPITLFDASKLATRIAAEVKGFDPKLHLPASVKWKRMARHTQFALAAMDMALADAGLEGTLAAASRPVSVMMGVSSSAVQMVEMVAQGLLQKEDRKMSPWLIWASQPHAVSVTLAEYLGGRASPHTVSTACKSGADSILASVAAIRSGRAEVAIAGGTDASVAETSCSAFSAGGVLSTRNDDPQRASRPFDRDRDGGILGEGAGVVVVESLSHARARGAHIWLEICGGASNSDMPRTPAGEGLGACMTLSLANAHLSGDAIDYVCAHGPSDPVIDRMETVMLRNTLGRHAYRIPVSSIKGVTGNPLAAAGPLELIACALAMRDDLIPPTANYTTPDPTCDLDYVPRARRCRIEHALLNVHCMGGGNTTLIVRKPQP